MPLNNETDDPGLDNPDIQDYRATEDIVSPSDADIDSSVEDQARALGWVPEEDYTGKAPWAAADEFLELHARNNGALKKALERQSKDIADLKKAMQGMDAAHKRIFDLQIKKQREEFDQQIAFLRAQKKEALRAGEHETAADIDDQIDTLRERGPELPEVPESTTPSKPAPGDWRKNPVMVDWASRNPWFEQDEDMSAYAGGMGQQIRANNPAMPFVDLLEEVTKRVKRAFPHKFTRRTSPVEETTPGATGGTAARGGTYASLPRDAKQMCDEAVADGGITQKQWVELYYGYEDRRKR